MQLRTRVGVGLTHVAAVAIQALPKHQKGDFAPQNGEAELVSDSR